MDTYNTIQVLQMRVAKLEHLIEDVSKIKGTIHLDDIPLWNELRNEADMIKEKRK